MVSHIRRLQSEELALADASLQGARQRLRPVLTATLLTLLVPPSIYSCFGGDVATDQDPSA